MRCTRHAALDCRTTELCEIMGCQARVCSMPPTTPAPAPAEPALGRLERLAVRLHDRIDALGRKPEPEPLPPLPSLTVEELLSEIRTMLPEPAPMPVAPPPAPPPPPPAPAKQAAREVKIVSVPAGGWVFVEAGAPIAVALDATGAGQTLAQLLATR